MTLHFSYYPCWPLGDNCSIGSSAPVGSRWLWPVNRTLLDVDSMVVSWWIVAFLRCVTSLVIANSKPFPAFVVIKIPQMFVDASRMESSSHLQFLLLPICRVSHWNQGFCCIQCAIYLTACRIGKCLESHQVVLMVLHFAQFHHWPKQIGLWWPLESVPFV